MLKEGENINTDNEDAIEQNEEHAFTLQLVHYYLLFKLGKSPLKFKTETNVT